MSVGRNDTCPCGSGKKYKKCCLAKDEAQAHQASASRVAIEPKPDADREETPEPPPDPRREAWDARYVEFDSAVYEDRIAIFTRTLDEPELMNGEMAFEMLNMLHDQAAEHNERDRFDALTRSLGERLPDVYSKEEKYVIKWRVINALALDRHEAIPAFVNDLGRLPGLDIDNWNGLESRLAYHGHLPTLVEAMRLAWPQVRDSYDIVSWGIDEFSFRGVQYEIMQYIEQTPAPDGGDPGLQERIAYYYGDGYDKDRVAELVAQLTGRADRRWTLDDFKLPSRQQEAEYNRADEADVDDEDWDAALDEAEWDDDDLDELDEEDGSEDDEEDWSDDDDSDEDENEGAEEAAREEKKIKPPHPAVANLHALLALFVRYLHQCEGVSYPKTELVRSEMLSFICNRRRGDLEYRESMFDAMLRSQGLNKKPLKKYKPYKHELIPDRERFDRHISAHFGMLGQQPYRAAALMELTPAWMRFLELQGLVDAEMRRQALRDLSPLADELLKIYKQGLRDRALCDAMERWKWDAGKDPVKRSG
jgi:hypothetical protein